MGLDPSLFLFKKLFEKNVTKYEYYFLIYNY